MTASSFFRATVELSQKQWEYHCRNPSRISELCQRAIDQEIALEALPDAKREAAEDAAIDFFFNVLHPGLEGDYAICNSRLVRGEATEQQIAADARSMGVPPESVIDSLDRNLAREIYIALLRLI